ncbi:MAG TPA: DnaA regulatory inactivator Hda [Rubrivivax sp.]|nr:DnaA regulatory inactivator Hda [Pseudomonadota bacterium]HOW46066.1 DnaA regulatory inactivator Hda [Rubrivivax sp.]HRY89521.1 DnaA regulatory inactivator Hda [Rubrivivax sp.]HRZ59129.1 DnaA regulatory inactivator Hda [Rubrivivax sp.]
MKQIPLAIGPEATPTFESFVPGANVAAVEHLRALGPAAPPVYLWGPSGSGKTHLLRALVHAHQAQGGRAGFVDAGRPAPWPAQEGCSLIVLDGCDQLDAAQQHAAFALFVGCAEQGQRWAAAGRVPPVDLALRDDLRTRLGWGHVFALQPPAEPEARAIVRREADRRGIFLTDEVMAWLLTRQARDLGSLMRLLDRLDRFALARQRAVTLPLLRTMLDEEPAGVPQPR